jgi:mono/diheme cytochrome c family protein
MKRTACAILIVTSTLWLSTAAFAQHKVTDVGKLEFEESCAVCHGMDAKGNGFLTSSLKVAPPDLTLLTKNNGNVFPMDRVNAVIDGRTQIASHGSRDMPIWGSRYAVNAAEHYFDAPYDQEAYVRYHILNLVDYLYRIQKK